ncbi:MAG: tetratricopeptide repeat protein, partial [Gemmatimonadota bacterium]
MIARRDLRSLTLLAGLTLAGCVGSDDARAQGPDALLRQGEYDEAVAAMEQELRNAPSPEAAAELAGVLVDIGRLDEAEDLLRESRAQYPESTAVALELGRLLQHTGRLDEAAALFGQVGAPPLRGDALLAELHRGEILLERGERERALEVFDKFIDVYNGSGALNSRELYAVARAVQHLGVTDTGLYGDALRAFDESIAADPDNLDAHVGVGMLFLQTYNLPDARASFREALNRRRDHPPALLGMALAAQLENSPEAAEIAEQALEVNPDLPGARLLRARTRLAGEDMEGAEEDLEAALAVDPTSSEALGILAAARYLQGRMDEFEALRDRALESNPRDAEFFVTVADLVSTRRFYAEAVEFAARGVALDSLAWEAFGAQGLNQLRTGEMSEGRESLEVAFAGDPYNLWIKNTLDLLDLMDSFETYESERLQVLVDPEDGEALATYMLEVGEEAYSALSERYGYAPETPVRIEAFRRSADFSVRTVGMAGLGALGVAFGRVVAMDSPAARGTEGFHWASTLWHELAHVVHLGLTDHHMPRWLSEGLAVHEERIAGGDSGWGYRPSLPFFAAYLSDRLRTPSELSLSFVRPRSPEEVGFAYILGS